MTISRFQSLKPTSRLAAFLYALMTDHLPVGTVTQLVANIAKMPTDELTAENGWLLEYAKDLAEMLRP